MGALLAPFGIGTGCQDFLQARQQQAVKQASGSADPTQPVIQHGVSFSSILSSQVIGLPGQPDGTPQTQHAGTGGEMSSEPAPPSFLSLLAEAEAGSRKSAEQLWPAEHASQSDKAVWAAHGLATGRGETECFLAPSASGGCSPDPASFSYLTFCCVGRLVGKEDLHQPHGAPLHTAAEALADITLRVLHEHDFDLDGMEEARRPKAPPPRPLRATKPAIKAAHAVRSAAAGPLPTAAPLPAPAVAAEAAAQRKKVRRARILRDGSLTMILYGADEALKWQMRVAAFLQAARGVLGDRRRVPGQWAGSVLDSVVGVFLTQNVSDALSSKAWMTLAATFPLAAARHPHQEVHCLGGRLVAGPSGSPGNALCEGQVESEQESELACEKAGSHESAAAATSEAGHGHYCKDTADSIDWEAVRKAPVEQVAATIKCRGMHNKLAARLQILLNQISVVGPGLDALAKEAHAPKEISEALPDSEEQRLKKQRTGAAPSEESPDDWPTAAATGPSSSNDTGCPEGNDQAMVMELVTNQHASYQDSLVEAPGSMVHTAGEARESVLQEVATNDGEEMQAATGTLDDSPVACSPPEDEQLKPDVTMAEDEQILTTATDACQNVTADAGKEQDVGKADILEAGETEAKPGRESSAPVPCMEDRGAEDDRAKKQGIVHPMTLEWLRDVGEEDARQYLMGVTGLGRKSVACVLLLALWKHDFPVDTNVGRICARLGWIPLDAEEALEDLDRYAPEPEVHKYLHSRLMHFDIDTLYELHYQMITLGKVFCSKRDPNCSACPLRSQCEYALANGRHLKKKPGPSPAATHPAPDQPATPEAAKPPQHGSYNKVRSPEPSSKQVQDAGSGELIGAGSAGSIQGHADEGMCEAAEPQGGPCTPRAGSCAEGLAGSEDSGVTGPGTPTKSTEAGAATRPHMVGSETEDSQAAVDRDGACVAEAALPDIEDLEKVAVPSKLQRTQSQELARILGTGEDCARELDSCQHTDNYGPTNLRLLEAAAAVLDILPQESQAGQESRDGAAIEALLQGCDAKAVRRRFKELSVLVHPDKCTLAGARQAFDHLRRAQDVLVEHVSPQHAASSGGLADASPDSSAGGGQPGQGQYVLLQAYEVQVSWHGLLSPAVTEHHTADDLPLLLLPLPAQVSTAASPSSDAGKANIVSLLTAPSTARTDVVLADNMTCTPGLDPTSARGSGGESASEAAPGAAGCSEPAARQPGYAVLVPCRTAMRGRFPLNGTYFQVNEVFLDDTSLHSPLQVAAEVVGAWPRRPVYFGTSVVGVCRGMRQADVARFFSDGLLCIRAFDPIARFPCPLPGWALPGKAPKPPATPPATERPKGEGRPRGPPQGALPLLRAALDGATVAAAAGPSRALVPLGSIAALPAAQAAAQRVKRKYTRRITTTFVTTAAGLGGGMGPGLPGTAAAPALMPAGDARTGGNAAQAQASGEKIAAALGAQPLLASDQAMPTELQSHASDCHAPKRRQLHPRMKASERCGHCLNCLNPELHQACSVRRREWLQSFSIDVAQQV